MGAVDNLNEDLFGKRHAVRQGEVRKPSVTQRIAGGAVLAGMIASPVLGMTPMVTQHGHPGGSTAYRMPADYHTPSDNMTVSQKEFRPAVRPTFGAPVPPRAYGERTGTGNMQGSVSLETSGKKEHVPDPPPADLTATSLRGLPGH